jgi:starch synthase
VREDVPLLAAIMRLSEQKGMHLIDAIIHSLEYADVQLVIVGAGVPMAEKRARQLATRYPGKFSAIVGDQISYEPAVVHQVEAGADIFMMPSLYEPCGLNQMFSLRYGTVPVARATGGLEDTVQEYEPETGQGNGFKFFDPTPDALAGALGRAIYFYRNRKDDWLRIVRNGMSDDFSWDTAARKYLSLYESAVSRKSPP